MFTNRTKHVWCGRPRLARRSAAAGWTKPSLRRRRGAVTLEMAFCLPIFLMLSMGILEFGQAFMVQQVVVNAAREGARHGVLPGATNAEVEAKVREYLAVGDSDNPNIVVNVTPTSLGTSRSGTVVRVRVTAPFSALTWLPAPWFLGQATLTSECVMRHE